jgi:hypothetical protein
MLDFMPVFNKILDGRELIEVQLDRLVGGIEREMAAATVSWTPQTEWLCALTGVHNCKKFRR